MFINQYNRDLPPPFFFLSLPAWRVTVPYPAQYTSYICIYIICNVGTEYVCMYMLRQLRHKKPWYRNCRKYSVCRVSLTKRKKKKKKKREIPTVPGEGAYVAL